MYRYILTFLLAFSFLTAPLTNLAHADETPALTDTTVVSAPADPIPNQEPAPEITLPVIEEPVATSTEAATTTPVLQSAPALEVVEATSMPAVAGLAASTSLAFSLDLPNGCDITDTDGQVHAFPEATSSPEYLAACALAEAKAQGKISGFEVAHASFGLYVTSVDGIAAGPQEYWALWVNDGFASCGIDCLELHQGDVLRFTRTTFEGQESDSIAMTVTSLAPRYQNIVLPDHCVLVDSDGVAHPLPETDSPSEYLAACALAEAKAEGKISGYAVQNASFGLYVAGVNGVAAGPQEYWALWFNGGFADCGITCLPLSLGDTVSFVRTTFDGAESDRYDLHVIKLTHQATSTPANPGDGGSGGSPNTGFDVPAALAFLATQQGTDGSFPSDLVTDWSAFALTGSARAKLVSYLRHNEPRFSSVRDYERHAMALLALGINPYTGGPSDYITPIVKKFDGQQIDNPGLVNDDIFAIIPLLHAGYTTKDAIIANPTAFIISEQHPDGSWEASPSITAAAIQALTQVAALPDTGLATLRAENYLRTAQNSDGGFGDQSAGVSDPFATSWVIQALDAAGEDPHAWQKNGNDPLEYLASSQQADGGAKTSPDDANTRAWATSYAVPAVQGLTWDSVMRSFSKPAGTGVGATPHASSTTATTTTATTTPSAPEDLPGIDPVPPVATTTPLLGTVTAPIAPVPGTHAAPVIAVQAPATTSTTTRGTDLTAGVGNSGAWNALGVFLYSFWHALLSLLGKIF